MNRTYPHIARTTALALLVALGTACGNDSPIAPAPTPGSGTPVDIGRLEIASTPDAASPATRVSINSLWQNGDAIIVSATKAGAGADKQNATYIYNESSKSWALKSATPLYVEQISPSGISIETWGGYTDDGLAADPTLYTDQSDPAAPAPSGYTSGDRYRRNDHLLCSDASLSGRTLNGSLAHLRVDFVLQITDGTDPDRLNILPTNAVLTLNADGTTPATAQKQIVAYREQKTADGTTNFRAHIDLADVPGISLDPNGTATVSPGSLLGTLTYTMPSGNGGNSGNTPKTLKIRYSITSTTDAGGTGTSGNNIPIVAGKRIVVSATFADLSYLDATATLTPWKDLDGWHAGTEEIGMEMTSEKGANGQPIYKIYTAQGLKEFADLVNGTGEYAGKQNRSANAKLMADVDLSSVCGETKGNWTPIGKNIYNRYIGCFDGQGHTVKGLYIQGRTERYTGLFGYIGGNYDNSDSSSIIHLRVKAEKMSSTTDHTGVLVGYSYRSNITDCYASGDVSGANYIAGLVGESAVGTITNCYAMGNITGVASIGGLAGRNYRSKIALCYATGNVSGSEENIGGLVGHNVNNSTINVCYATGSVSGSANNTGGLVGLNNGIITNCYSTGITSENDNSGGLVGNNSYSIHNCVTTQPDICGLDASYGNVLNCHSEAKSFTYIRSIVALNNEDNWKPAVDGSGTTDNGTPDDDLLTGGSLHLWWQP